MTEFNKTLKVLNQISPSFCVAKWFNATIWLANGRTASCHHPPSHPIPLEEIAENPAALHNTKFKKARRQEMIDGIRPEECSYCWRIEDTAINSNPPIYSDRVYKSGIYNIHDIQAIKNIPTEQDVDPKRLEISFDNLCNLNCSYCNHEFSSTWTKDIAINGPFVQMETQGGRTYINTLDQIKLNSSPFGLKNENNPYIESFFKWFHKSLKFNLKELRVTGGEPSRSPWFWKLLDECENPVFDFAVNSNLMMDRSRMKKLVISSKKFKKFDLYTSAECVGKNQEFVRHNFKWDIWKKNLIWFAKELSHGNIHIMMTISALSVWTVDEFIDIICKLRKDLGNSRSDLFHMSVNILRFPSFQSVNTISSAHKIMLADSIEQSINRNKHILTSFEVNQFNRLILYLREVEVSYEDMDDINVKLKDFHSFVKQYSIRNQMPLEDYMPQTFLNWWGEYYE
jgi:organic radical activating enzyme